MKILEIILKIIKTKQVYIPIIAITLGIIACKGMKKCRERRILNYLLYSFYCYFRIKGVLCIFS